MPSCTPWTPICAARGGPGLSVVRGKPVERRAAGREGGRTPPGCTSAADFGPYGRRRDERVAEALADAGRELVRTGSPYAVAPGTLFNKSGDPFQVFTPFHRTWLDHGVHDPASAVRVAAPTGSPPRTGSISRPADDDAGRAGRGAAGPGAVAGLAGAGPEGVADYPKLHDLPGADATSHLSIALRWGHLHPRTVLKDLAEQRSDGARALARQIAWRDFFADVLWHRPRRDDGAGAAGVQEDGRGRAGPRPTTAASA